MRGPSVMHGYWGDPERTRAGAAPLRRADSATDSVYRTGDLVRQAAGRCVPVPRPPRRQVKSRGYRDRAGRDRGRALRARRRSVECAARAEPDEIAGTRITAYVVVRDAVEEADLVAACLERIPRYAVPDAIAFRAELPKTSTGKIDRRALVGS